MFDLPSFVFVFLGLAFILAIVLYVAFAGVPLFLQSFRFVSEPLMNNTEMHLFKILSRGLPRGWTIMSQVAYGSFLSHRQKRKYYRINAKRADFVVVDPDLRVAAVLEYQGSGHYGNTYRDKKRATESDRVKQRACKQAGIPWHEIPARYDTVEVLRDLALIAKTHKVHYY